MWLLWRERPLWQRGSTYFGQMIDATTGFLLIIMLGDITEIERDVHNTIMQHDPRQRFSTYHNYQFSSSASNQ